MNEQYRNAIGSVESGNDYSALGPETNSGDRAYGRYQVMGNNIPEWTEKHLGVRMTPDQFLKDQAAQDKVFDAVTGGYHDKYGNLDDVTSSWFSGRPMARAGNASDGYNTVPQYVAKVNKAMGGPVAAINAAAQIPGPGSLTSAFAQTDQQPDAALSVNSTMGPGVLNRPDAANVIGQSLTGLGASLAGISSPEQAKSLVAQQVAMKKADVDHGTWAPHTLPDGTTFMLNSKTRQLLPMGNFKKSEQDPGDKKRAEEEAKAEVENYGKMQDSIGVAQTSLSRLKELRAAAQDPNVNFGGGGDIMASAKNLAYSLGVPVEGLKSTQAVQRLATEMQLARGKQLPGAISNYEDKLMGLANGVGLDKSRESNLAAIDAQEKLFNHQIMLANAAREYRAEHGKLDAGWDKKRQQMGEAAAKADDAATAPAAAPTAQPTSAFKTKSGVTWSVNH